MIRVTVWNEFRHEKASKEVAAIYPNGLHATIAEFLGKNDDIECRLACLDDPEHGLTDDVLDNTDVLIWWGHMAHDQVSDAVVDKVQDHVLRGMGLIVLHSGHNSKIPVIPLHRVFRSTLNWTLKRCTANSLIFPNLLKPYSSAGSTAAKYLEAA